MIPLLILFLVPFRLLIPFRLPIPFRLLIPFPLQLWFLLIRGSTAPANFRQLRPVK